MFSKFGIVASNNLNFRIQVPDYVAQLVLSMTEQNAIDTIAEYGFTSRVVSRDGVPEEILDFSYVETRINLDIVSGIVTQVYIG